MKISQIYTQIGKKLCYSDLKLIFADMTVSIEKVPVFQIYLLRMLLICLYFLAQLLFLSYMQGLI